jgi:hypothetical protein
LKLKIDENLPNGCAGILRGEGFEADTVTDERLTGAEDSAIALKAQGEGRVLITLDLDFANIRACPPAEYAGIIVGRSKLDSGPTVRTGGSFRDESWKRPGTSRLFAGSLVPWFPGPRER